MNVHMDYLMCILRHIHYYICVYKAIHIAIFPPFTENCGYTGEEVRRKKSRDAAGGAVMPGIYTFCYTHLIVYISYTH